MGWVTPRGALAAGAVLLAPPLGLVGLNAWKAPLPPSPYAEADLPALPPAEDNGWTAFTAGATSPVPAEIPGLSLFDPDRDPAAAWQELAAGREGLVAALTPEGRAAAEGLEHAADRPRFVDACPLPMHGDCPTIALFHAHTWSTLTAAERALTGEWALALAGASRLLVADVDHASSPRSVVSLMVALDDADRALRVLAVLLEGQVASGAPPFDPTALLAAREAVARAERLEPGLRSAVVAEYLGWAGAIEKVGAGERSMTEPTLMGQLRFDVGRTRALLDARAATWVAYAEDAAAPRPDDGSVKVGALWWLRNAEGQELVDLSRMDLARLLDDARASAARIRQRAGVVRARLDQLGSAQAER